MRTLSPVFTGPASADKKLHALVFSNPPPFPPVGERLRIVAPGEALWTGERRRWWRREERRKASWVLGARRGEDGGGGGERKGADGDVRRAPRRRRGVVEAGELGLI